MKTIKLTPSTGESLPVKFSETAGTGKGKPFFFAADAEPFGFNPLDVARTAPEFMVEFLERAAEITFDDWQKQAVHSVLAELPQGATMRDLYEAIKAKEAAALGITPEQYEGLEPLFRALQKMQEEGKMAGLFAENDGN